MCCRSASQSLNDAFHRWYLICLTTYSMQFVAQHRAGRPGRDNSLMDKHLHRIKRSRPGVVLALLAFGYMTFSSVPAQTKPIASKNTSPPTNSSPSRKAAILRYQAGTSSRIQTRAGFNVSVSSQPNAATQSGFRALLQSGNEPPKKSDASPHIRVGFGRIFPEKHPESSHPNDRRLDDRSWLYVEMNVKF